MMGRVTDWGLSEGGEGVRPSKALVLVATWILDGEGDRDIMPDAILGFPMERRTVSSVLSIFRSERVRISCFLQRWGCQT